jgi:hypothetical protein
MHCRRVHTGGSSQLCATHFTVILKDDKLRSTNASTVGTKYKVVDASVGDATPVYTINDKTNQLTDTQQLQQSAAAQLNQPFAVAGAARPALVTTRPNSGFAFLMPSM